MQNLPGWSTSFQKPGSAGGAFFSLNSLSLRLCSLSMLLSRSSAPLPAALERHTIDTSVTQVTRAPARAETRREYGVK